jgi:ParB family chromosome partitioning protein
MLVQMKPTGFFKADPNNPRKSVDEAEIDRLGDDLLARGVLVPLLARLDGTLIDGWRRWLAALKKAMKELPAILTDKPEEEIRGIQLATAFHKVDLTAYEKWLALEELRQSRPQWGMKELAGFLHIDASMVTRLLSPSKCIAAWQDTLKDGGAGISDCYAASKLPEKEQMELLTLKRSGASRDAIERAGRKKRSGNAPVVRMSRVKIAMPHGAAVVVSGNDLGMAEVVELLSDTLKEARKAAEQYDVKTFQSMMRDRAKAG